MTDLPTRQDNTKQLPTQCLNCGEQNIGKFCPRCGQRNLPRRQNLADLITNFVASFTSFDGRFFETFRFLLFKPGQIVYLYNQGKRERFYHPARMYVFLSFIFFLLFFTVVDPLGDARSLQNIEATENPPDSLSSDTVARGLEVSLSDEDLSATFNLPTSLAQYDSLQAALPPAERDGAVKRYFKRRLVSTADQFRTNSQQAGIHLAELFLNNLPKTIFVLMPIFALLLKLLFIRRDFFYSEHLVYTIYLYDFYLLCASLWIVLASIVDWDIWSYVFWLWFLYYLIKSIRVVYKQSRLKTLIKSVILLSVFSVVVVLSTVVALIISVLQF